MKNYFMKEALKEARKSYEKKEVPIGAVVVLNGEIIGRGHNLKIITKDPTAHGEIIAIKEACKNVNHWWLENCEIYTTLEPCPMCMGAMLNARIKKLYIGAKDERMGASGSLLDLSKLNGYNHSFEVEFGIMERECRDILSEFFKEIRKEKLTR